MVVPSRLRWISRKKLEEHFLKPGRRQELGVRTPEEYEESARQTVQRGLQQGTRFTYEDIQSGEQRVGYFDRTTGRFTALTGSELRIVTHLVPSAGERYCRTRLNSSYPS